MRCVNCQTFQGLRKYNNSLNGSYWKCNGQEIFADTDACKDFLLNPVLVCPKKNKFRRMPVEACLHYQKEKGCKCRIGAEVRAYKRKQLTGKIIKRRT